MTQPADTDSGRGATPPLHPDLARAARAHLAGDRAAAERHYRAVLAEAPETLTARYYLSALLAERRAYRQARDELAEAVAQAPDDAGMRVTLARLERQAGAPERARSAARAALAALDRAPAPQQADWHSLRGRALAELDADEAEPALQRAAALAPAAAAPRYTLAEHEVRRGRYAAAEAAYRAVLARLGSGPEEPAASEVYAALGHVQLTLGRPEAAVASLEAALARAPGDPVVHANLLLALHYDPRQTAERLRAAHFAWGRGVEAAVAPACARPQRSTDTPAPLRVAVLAGKLRSGPVGFLFGPALHQLASARIELWIYDTGTQADSWTHALAAAATQWRSVAGLSDSAAAAQIAADGPDILINKMGHAEGRLGICAHKPAPVQVQWGGYNTTGLAALDALIGDPVETPPAAEADFAETVYRMPSCYAVYAPPAYAPEVSPLPMAQSGTVTFGCFNHPAKINDTVLAAWAHLLAQVPGSRLLLKGAGLDDGETAAAWRARAEAAGLAPQRVLLAGRSPHEQLLASYGQVDIALDPWPYSGGLTTLEALWMGVPVVTLPGPSFAGRHAASYLHAAGLTDWIAESWAGYRAIAAGWAAAPEALAALRASLRSRVAASPLGDSAGFARDLEALLGRIWAAHRPHGERQADRAPA